MKGCSVVRRAAPIVRKTFYPEYEVFIPEESFVPMP